MSPRISFFPAALSLGAVLFAANLVAEPQVTGSATPPAEPMSVWFEAPARSLSKPRGAMTKTGTKDAAAAPARKIDFLQSLPVGNGRLGAMDCGGIELERVILNESSVWSGGDYDGNMHDAYKSLPEIRKKLFAGDILDAKKLLDKSFRWADGTKRYHNDQFGCYQTLGDLLVVDTDAGNDAEAVSDYRRDLNLMTGVVTTTFKRGGVTYTRELFASKPDEAIVLRLRADKPGALSFRATLARPAQAENFTARPGEIFGMRGQLTFDFGKDGKGVCYAALLGANVAGGKKAVGKDGISVTGANEATLFLTAGTDMHSPKFLKTAEAQLDGVMKKQIQDVRDAAAADHGALMARCRLELPVTDSSKLPTPERLKQMKKRPDPALAALYFQFGRHLLVSSSRADSPLPANLQGIWAEEVNTPWHGDFHSNINLQMNYWPAEPTNLSECHLPLIRLIDAVAKTGAVTAKSYYNAPGWMCYHTQNPWAFSGPSNTSAGAGSTCGGWLAQHIRMHYDYTLDEKFLRENYPLLRGASEFFLATLTPEPKHGRLVTAPSNSPENGYVIPGGNKSSSLTYGATYDQQIIRDLFESTANAARLLKTDGDFAAKLDAARAKLAPTRLGTDGRIMEWIEEYKEVEPHHRHVSHLWGLHPGTEINPNTPELFAGARKSLEARGDASTGWSMAWKANFWARLRDGDRSAKLLSLLIGNGAPNLFCLHPPFQIDGNFGGTAAISEMLLQSHDGTVTLLPALPKAWASAGRVSGMRARGDLTVDFSWKNGAVESVKITGKPGKAVVIVAGGKRIEKTIPSSGVLEFTLPDLP